MADELHVDPPELVGYARQIARAAEHLGSTAQRLPDPLVKETGGYEGVLDAIVPPFNSLLNLYHGALRAAQAKMAQVEVTLRRSAARYVRGESDNQREMRALGQRLPGPDPSTTLSGQERWRPRNEYADVADPVAALGRAPRPSGSPQPDPTIRRLRPRVHGVAAVWQEQVGGNLNADLIDPLLADIGRVEQNALQWEQVGAALEAIRDNVSAGLRTLSPAWTGGSADIAKTYLSPTWTRALTADAATAKQMGAALRGTVAAFRRIIGPAAQHIEQVVAALTQARPLLARQEPQYRQRGQQLLRQAVTSHNSAVGQIMELASAVGDTRKILSDILAAGLALPRVPDLQGGAAQGPPRPVQAGGGQPGPFGTGGAYRIASQAGGPLDMIQLTPRDPRVPPVTIPNHTAADGFQVGPFWNLLDPSHTYRVDTYTDIPFDQGRDLIGREIIDHPVPNELASPATPEGTRNDAAWGQYVRSYVIPSTDPTRYTDIMVNYTIAGEHQLHEGYVIRYGEIMPNGNTMMVSYGEGNSIFQHPMMVPFNQYNDRLWQLNQEGIEGRVSQQLGLPPPVRLPEYPEPPF